MANLTPTAVSKSSNFVTGPSGDRTNDVLTDLLANRTEIYANMTSIADEFYGATPPANPNVGRKWRCSTTAGLYVANTTYRWNGSAWAIDIAETVNVPQRNCVLEGPVNSAGETILFSVGTGLTVDLKATVRLSFANGFTDDGGASDYFESITADDAAFWSSLPINSTVQLYIDRDSGGTVTGGYSTLAPVYQSYAPTHSAGLNWYDTNTQKIFVSNGSEWTQVWRVFVGTATTDGTETTSVSINVNNSGEVIKANDIITKGPWIDVRAFGAIGDGVTDDTAAIQSAITYACTNNSVVFFPPKRFLITSNLNINADLTILGSNESIIIGDVDKVFDITPLSPVLSTTLNGATAAAVTEIVLADTTGIVRRQLLVIQDSATLWPYDSRAGSYYGEVAVIRAVNHGTKTVTVEWDTATAYNSGVSAVIWNHITVTIKDMNFERLTKTSNSNAGITTYACKNAVFQNCNFTGFGAVCLQDSYSISTHITGCNFNDGWYAGVGLGYGVLTVGSVGAIVSNCKSFNQRHCVDFSGSIPSRYCMAIGCIATSSILNTDACNFSTHGTAQYCTFKSCVSISSPLAFTLRGADITIDGCTAYNSSLFAACSAGLNHTFIGCVSDGQIASGYPPGGFIDATSPDYVAGGKSLSIRDCYAKIATYFLYINDVVINGAAIELANNKAGLRTTGTNFVTTANLASAKTFTIYTQNNIAYVNDANTPYLLRLSPGTNATLDERTILSASAGYNYSGRRVAAPTTGTWRNGDIIYNTAPAVGGVFGWVCTTAGTPGTWSVIGVPGMVQGAARADSAATDVAGLKTDFNDLLAKLRTAKIIAT